MSDVPVVVEDVPVPDATVEPGSVSTPHGTVGGAAALAGEATDTDDAGEDTRPVLDVRGELFHLRSGVPQVLIGDMVAKLQGIDRIEKKEVADRTPAEQAKIVGALAAIHNSLVKLIVPDERDAFVEHVTDVEPPVEAKEWSSLMSAATEAIGGRPTQAS